ncbi:MAG: hypothetical protein MK183_06230 [Verrucomicrobiales bacterium]|nr:hypothetical protein [Verrucomicrobiales bacterium]
MSGNDNTGGRGQLEARLAELGVSYSDNPQDFPVVQEIADLYWQLEDWENAASYYEYAFSLDPSRLDLQSRAEAARQNIGGQQGDLPAVVAAEGHDRDAGTSRVKDLRPERDKGNTRVPDNTDPKPAGGDDVLHTAVNLQAKKSRDPVAAIKKGAKQLRSKIPVFMTGLRNLNRSDCKRWASSIAALALLLFVLWNVGGKMRGEVWRYYTDEQGIKVDAEEGKVRDVLWEEPVVTRFSKDPGAPSPDSPDGKTGQAGLTGRLEAAFSANGAMMALVRRNADGSNADLYLSNWDGRSWSSPKPIKAINTEADESGPTFSHDGNYLYFSSDREGGAGGNDIYVARWNNGKWGDVVALGETINTANDELGPAIAGDGKSLLFSSIRTDKDDEDIYIASLKEVKQDSGELPQVPEFAQAEPVLGDLNSRADDIQAALTKRGDHVFLASNRDQERFGVYISRFVDGKAREPERVDLYIDEGDVTDPAVRMDGFDLLFSSDRKLLESDQEGDFRLFRSTTREVFGYTDRRIWNQFKELIGNIKWWLLLAIAALLALIYLLEKWRDISSLYHKCLAGSAIAHLLSLLLGMVWLISSEIEADSQDELEEVSISLDALSQEELAMESMPEEVEITDHSEAVATAKAETDFDAPDLKPQEFEENISVASSEVQQEVEIEVAAAQADFQEEAEIPVTDPSQLTADLSETLLPDLEQPLLEENTEANPAEEQVDPSEDIFRPETENAPVAKSDTAPLQDSAVELPTDLSEVTEVTADNAAQANEVSAVSQLSPQQIDQVADVPAEDAVLQSDLLSTLPDQLPVQSEQPILEEAGNDAGGEVADASADMFKPAGADSGLETSRADSEVVGGSAAENPVESSEVGGGDLVAEASDAAVRPSGVSGVDSDEPQAESTLESGALPELALLDPGAPTLEEAGNDAGGEVADASADMFKPAGADSGLETSRADSEVVGGSALGSPSSASDVLAANGQAGPGMVNALNGLEALGSQIGSGQVMLVAAPSLGENPLAINDPLLPGKLESLDEGPGMGNLGEKIRKHRGKPSLDVIKQMGGSDETEKAIGFAIEWLSKNQEKDGRWDARKHGANQDYDVGATGLALLCYYGWGARHDRKGHYQENVSRGINWLLKQQKSNGALAVRGQMYAHAIASIALCEAYGLTKDPRIKPVAQKAIAYTVAAQHPALGGWRYSPGQEPDTSVTGWQFMALHSARMAGLKVPEKSFELARRWLGSMSGGKDGGLYGYQAPEKISRAMVPTGMFCRQLDLVSPEDPRMLEGAAFMRRYPMREVDPDLYYVYYATLALYQHQGPVWDEWNRKLKTALPRIQRKDGAMAGSWDLSSKLAKDGGRVISTTLATLSLEVYYRFLPMYGFRQGVARPVTE